MAEGLVQRRAGITEPAHPGAVTERLVERLAKRDRDILHGVVGIDPQIALAGERDVDQRVARECGEHVVEKSDSGGHGRGAGAGDRDAAVDRGLRGHALHTRRAIRAARPGAGRRAQGVQQQVVGRGGRRADPDALGQLGIRRGADDQALGGQASGQRLTRLVHVEQQEVGAGGPHPDTRGCQRRRHAVALGHGGGRGCAHLIDVSDAISASAAEVAAMPAGSLMASSWAASASGARGCIPPAPRPGQRPWTCCG